jgi:hypothetical protein
MRRSAICTKATACPRGATAQRRNGATAQRRNGATAQRRNGATAQLWLTRAFVNERFALGIGAGAYAAIHHGDADDMRDTGDGILSGLLSITASYRMTQRWSPRVTWNRVMTRYSRDTDVILGGIGYGF